MGTEVGGRLGEGLVSVGRKEGVVLRTTIAFDSFLILSIFELVQFNFGGRLALREIGSGRGSGRLGEGVLSVGRKEG